MAEEYYNNLVDITRGELRDIACAGCNRTTRHKVVSSLNVRGRYSEPGFQRFIDDDYEIVECQGCRAVSFRHAHRDSEDSELVDLATGQSEPAGDEVQIFPHRISRTRIVPPNTWMPGSLSYAYPETVAAYEQNLPLLCAIGIRLCLEAFCRERKVPGKSLKDRIDTLVKRGEITSPESTILHRLRDVGNEAAHEAKPPKSHQVRAAMVILEGLLHRFYVVPLSADDLHEDPPQPPF